MTHSGGKQLKTDLQYVTRFTKLYKLEKFRERNINRMFVPLPVSLQFSERDLTY